MNRIAVRALGLALCAALTFGPAGAQTPPPGPELKVATFASGCFWCTESDFDKVEGVVSTVSGYTGGETEKPTYAEVGLGTTGHTEAVEVKFDPAKVSYEKLLDHYWRNVDAVDGGGQFCDRGSQYRPAIFTHSDEQKRLAEASKEALAKSGRFKQPIAVEIAPAKTFTPAEEYHQDFYKKSPLRYNIYRLGCGREARLSAIWGNVATQ